MSRARKSQIAVYEEIVDVTNDYLGPVSRRFVTKLAKSHLDKKPSELTRQDVPTLHEWGVKAFALIAEDDGMVTEFSDRLLSLQDE